MEVAFSAAVLAAVAFWSASEAFSLARAAFSLASDALVFAFSAAVFAAPVLATTSARRSAQSFCTPADAEAPNQFVHAAVTLLYHASAVALNPLLPLNQFFTVFQIDVAFSAAVLAAAAFWSASEAFSLARAAFSLASEALVFAFDAASLAAFTAVCTLLAAEVAAPVAVVISFFRSFQIFCTPEVTSAPNQVSHAALMASACVFT